MKKKTGDESEKFGDFLDFDHSIGSILLSFTPWNPVHHPHYLAPNNVVKTSVLLHNMMLKFDGLDKLWEVRMCLQCFASLPL